MPVKHICMICGNSGKLNTGKPCPLCRLQHNTSRMFDMRELSNKIGDNPNDYIVRDPLSFKGADPMFESIEDEIVIRDLREVNRKLVTVAARLAEQRAAFLRLSQKLSKHAETRDIAQFIEKAYSKMRSGWVNVEKAQEMTSRRLREVGVKESLGESGSDRQYSYHSTQVDIPEEMRDLIAELRDMIPAESVYREKSQVEGEDDPEEEYGLELNPHVTVLYGLTDDESRQKVQEICAQTQPFEVEFGKISSFRTADDFDVLKIDIVSPELHALSDKIRELPNENKYPEYCPHMTIGYIKKGSCQDLEGECDLTGEKVKVDKVTWSDRGGDKIPIPFGMSKDESVTDSVTETQDNPDHAYHHIPNNSKVVKNAVRFGIDVAGRRVYRKGKGSKERFYAWDRQHGEWELFNRRLRHLGAVYEKNLDDNLNVKKYHKGRDAKRDLSFRNKL